MIAYFDCFAGISGDMTLGAMIGLGIRPDYIEESIKRLPLSGFHLETDTIVRGGIRGHQVRVVVDDGQPHRDYKTIKELIGGGMMKPSVKQIGSRIFRRLAMAEAAVHGCDLDDVHFHEVGSVDAIVDILGAALAVDALELDAIYANVPTVGYGTVTCSHGTLPVPAPATAELLRGVPTRSGRAEGERVTPTGAAILTTLATEYGPMPEMAVTRIGYGAGQREFDDMPNLLRIMVGKAPEAAGSPDKESAVMVETCIDDMNPEIFGHVMERLFEDGALDVFWTPVHMKKNRPGTKVSVLCPPEKKDAAVRRLLTETTSLGVRCHDVSRHLLKREVITVDTAYGATPVKAVTQLDGTTRRIPEYEFCRKIAREQDIPMRTVYDTIAREVLAERGEAEA